MGVLFDRIARDIRKRPKAVALSAYGVKSDETDQSAKIQAAINDALVTNGRVVCDVDGVLGINAPVQVGDARANPGRLSILSLEGKLRLKTLAALSSALVVTGTTNWSRLEIEIDGDNKSFHGIYAKNIGRMVGGDLHTFNLSTSGFAVEPSGNNNFFDLRSFQAHQTGSAHTSVATVVSRSAETGWTALSASPVTSKWQLTAPLPPALRQKSWSACVAVMADGRTMPVTDIDTSAGTWVSIAHEDRPVGSSETITLYTAALNLTYFSDTGAWTINKCDISSSKGAALALGGYGGAIVDYAQQYCGRGVVIPIRATGFSALHFYTEGIPTMLTVGHANHPTAGTQVFLGAGSKYNAAIEVIDQGFSTENRAKRSVQPPHWIIQREHPNTPITPPPAKPVDAPELNPGTRNLTPGTIQAYRSTSPTLSFRIVNDVNPEGVGVVTCIAPPSGNGVTFNVSLLRSNGDTIWTGPSTTAATWSKVIPASSVLRLTYWREGTVWQLFPEIVTRNMGA